jgi:hypothetical protein
MAVSAGPQKHIHELRRIFFGRGGGIAARVLRATEGGRRKRGLEEASSRNHER